MPDDCPPAGFESHWDAAWFKGKSDECRRIAGISADLTITRALLELSTEFRRQSDHAALLAAVAFGRHPLPDGD